MRTLTSFSVILALLILAGDLAGQAARISGRVLDRTTEAPIPGAWLEISEGGRRTGVDSTGVFSLELRPGRYALAAHALGYASVTFTIALEADTSLVVQLDAAPLALAGIEVIVDRFARRNRALPWSVATVTHDELVNSAAANPVDVLRQRRVQFQPCRQGGDCVRWRGSVIVPVVCIDEMFAHGGVAELRTYPMASLYSIEVHDRGRMIRAYTTWFMDRVSAGDMALRAALRSDVAAC